MTVLLKKMWRRLGSIHLTVVLCLLLFVDLSVGYLCLNRNTILFAPLNDIGLATWIQTYGKHNLTHTLWFFVLLGLLTLLCVNTFVCTTDRVAALIARRRHFSPQRLALKFAPHIMHYAMIVILVGYLCSYLFARVYEPLTLIPGKPTRLAGTELQITLAELDPVYYTGSRLPAFEDRVLQPRASLRLVDGDRQQTSMITINRPLRYHGYSFFLKDFRPKKRKGGMNRTVRIDLTIRRDPGVMLYLVGIMLFTAGLAMYVAEWMFVRKTGVRPELAAISDRVSGGGERCG